MYSNMSFNYQDGLGPHPLTLSPVMEVIFSLLDNSDLQNCKLVSRAWYELSARFRAPFEKLEIHGLGDLETYMSRVRDNHVLVHNRFRLKYLDLQEPLFAEFTELHRLEIKELHVEDSCDNLEYLFRLIQFPNLKELILDTPLTNFQYTILLNRGLGPALSTSLGRLKLTLMPFHSRHFETMRILNRLKTFDELSVLHITGHLQTSYPVLLVLHQAINLRSLYMFGSAMRLPAQSGNLTKLAYLEIDGLHQIWLEGHLARLISVQTLVLRNEVEEVVYASGDMAWIFPALRTLRVNMIGSRPQSFLPMAFQLSKLVSLELKGNITDKVLCGTDNPNPPREGKFKNSLWRRIKRASCMHVPRIYYLEQLRSLTLTSPLITQTCVHRGIQYCNRLESLSLNMNPAHVLDMPAMLALGEMRDLDIFVLKYPENLRHRADEAFAMLDNNNK